LLGKELLGVGENQAAGIEEHRPPSRRVGEVVTSEVDGLRSDLAEILDDDAAVFVVGAWIHSNPAVFAKDASPQRLSAELQLHTTVT
jgi:hypothetical protein